MTLIRSLYAVNFAALFFTMLTSYLVNKPDISGFGFSNMSFPKYDPLLKSTHLLVLPTAYILTWLIGQKSFPVSFLKSSVVPLLFMQIISLCLQLMSVIIYNNFILYLISVALSNYAYSSLDFILDQLNAKLLIGTNNQAYRADGAVVASMIALLITYFKGQMAYTIGTILIVVGLVFYINATNNYFYTNVHDFDKVVLKKKSSGMVSLNTFILVLLTVIVTAFPDGLMDAAAKIILHNAKSSSPIIIRYMCLIFGYMFSNPRYVHYLSNIGIRYIATFIMLLRVFILYKFDSCVIAVGLTAAFALQSIGDIASGTIFKNDIEEENRDCLLNNNNMNSNKLKYPVPGWMANFIAEQFSPILKTGLSYAFYSMSMKKSFDRQWWMIIGAFSIITSTIVTTILQKYNKNHIKSD